MSKRARSTASTSLGDVNPQYLVQDVVLGAVNDYAVGAFQLPVARIGGSKNKAVVLEVLRVDWYYGLEDIADLVHTNIAFLTTAPNRSEAETCTLASMGVDCARPLNFAISVDHHATITSGGMAKAMPHSIDLTDGNGNGMLVATDRLTMVYGDQGSVAVSSCSVHILYRLIEVGIQEYVGIVQSQAS